MKEENFFHKINKLSQYLDPKYFTPAAGESSISNQLVKKQITIYRKLKELFSPFLAHV